MSKRQEKIQRNIAEQKEFLKMRAEQTWEQAQIQAATFQSVLDYAIKQYEEHKGELDEEMQKQTEEQIKERQKQIEEFLMKAKDQYLEKIGIQAD